MKALTNVSIKSDAVKSRCHSCGTNPFITARGGTMTFGFSVVSQANVKVSLSPFRLPFKNEKTVFTQNIIKFSLSFSLSHTGTHTHWTL